MAAGRYAVSGTLLGRKVEKKERKGIHEHEQYERAG